MDCTSYPKHRALGVSIVQKAECILLSVYRKVVMMFSLAGRDSPAERATRLHKRQPITRLGPCVVAFGAKKRPFLRAGANSTIVRGCQTQLPASARPCRLCQPPSLRPAPPQTTLDFRLLANPFKRTLNECGPMCVRAPFSVALVGACLPNKPQMRRL